MMPQDYDGSQSQGYFHWTPTCAKCGRFVKMDDVEPIDYHAAAGFYGEVIDGHRSHPQCGERVPIAEVARFIKGA